MAQREMGVSEQVIYTVAEIHGKDPVALPPLEETLNSEALNDLFHEPLSGAYTVFPYCDVWVMVHSNGTVDIFKEYAATSAPEELPDEVDDLTTDERIVVLHADDDRHTFYEDELETVHEIVEEADDCEEAWEDTLGYAEQR